MKLIQYLFLLLICYCFLISCKEEKSYIPVAVKNHSFSYEHLNDSLFLGDKKCKECHQKEFKSWKGSHHDKAMEIADSTTVLGDFSNTTYVSQGITSRFYKNEKDFYVNTEGPDGKYHDYKIVYTFGFTPLQQYIVKFPNGRYQCLRMAWDTNKNKWFDLYPDFKIVHSEWLHWSRGGLNWNTMCADCHSTNVRKNYTQKTESYTTKYSLINVSCEACHGPGKQHVIDVNKLGDDYVDSGTFLMTNNTSPKDLVDQCARCHMRREQFSEAYNFSGTLLDHYYPQVIEEGLYHADGQISEEVYVYGSFIQSKMYQNNISCNNCHDSHSLELKFEGNKLCAQCHDVQKYDTTTHHFHEMGTESAQCVNCHMPGKYYMGIDYRRDHSLRVPRPDLSVAYGTPNACTNCHSDKDNKWAWAGFQKLYGKVDSTHFSEKLIPGIHKQPNGYIKLLELIQNKKNPNIARASAVKALSNYNIQNFMEDYIALLNDESPIVRGASLDVLGEINTIDYISYFFPLLKDPKQSIRIKAFFGLSGVPIHELPEIYKDDYVKVEKEFWTYINANTDFLGGNVKKANYFLKKGDYGKGIAGYEDALKIDGLNNSVRLTLANLYYQNEEYDKAESAFEKVIELEPKYGPTYYSLALLLAEQERIDEAIVKLKKAKKIMPNNIRVYYNLSLLYDKKKDARNAEKTLIEGLKIDANNESLLYTLAYYYSNAKAYTKARNILEKLVKNHPKNLQYMNFLNQIKSQQ